MGKDKESLGDKEVIHTLCERYAKEKGISPEEVLTRLASIGCQVVLAEENGGLGLIVMPKNRPEKRYIRIRPFKENGLTS